ncbi:hypothetical protein L7F22_000489 [Adiantum nelumboides]|nr:hypothetical protein [Adiantum nelumboides]
MVQTLPTGIDGYPPAVVNAAAVTLDSVLDATAPTDVPVAVNIAALDATPADKTTAAMIATALAEGATTANNPFARLTTTNTVALSNYVATILVLVAGDANPGKRPLFASNLPMPHIAIAGKTGDALQPTWTTRLQLKLTPPSWRVSLLHWRSLAQ